MRFRVLAGAILVSAGLLTGGCGSGEDGADPFASGATAGPTHASGTPDGIIDPNRELAEIAEEVPGFAGYWRDPATGVYKINSTYLNISVDAVKAAILKRDPSLAQAFENARFEVVPVQVDASQLNTWYDEVLNEVIPGFPAELRLDWTFSDLDEMHNRLLFGFADEEARAWAEEEIAEKIDAPPGVIVVIVEAVGPDD